jgi:phosphatidylethanolamine-binding protein (PEBP) family uncharacterized protein
MICNGEGVCVPDKDGGMPPGDGGQPPQDGGQPPKDGGGGPVSCSIDDDCKVSGACPPDAKMGCACAMTPMGKMCVPKCSLPTDCPNPSLTCSTDGICVPDTDGGLPPGDGGQPPPKDGGGPGPDGGGPVMNTDNTISDEAQGMTIAFDGLAFVTGTFCAQTFYPPGKVADFFGFQYLRDNDPSALGHNTDFTTLTSEPVLAMMSDAQLKILQSLGNTDAPLGDQYALARFPLAYAFRRLYDGDAPSGHPALDVNAVKAYSAYLFSIDGEMSYLRAQAYSSVLSLMTTDQKAKLMLVLKGSTSAEWTALQPANKDTIPNILKNYPSKGDLRTYAGEMLSWYVGGVEPDVYFCPEREGTYFGSFFMKDIKAMNNPSYTIDSNMTADMGNAFLNTLDNTQKALVTGLVATQKADLLSLVSKREDISNALRNFLSSGTVDEATIIALSKQYGELDGEISYFYATNFSAVGSTLTAPQNATLMSWRKKATAEDGGTPDYDSTCGYGYLYSAPLKSAPVIIDTDFMFGVCSAAGISCSSDWDCCSYSCKSAHCSSDFTFSSTAFLEGGTLDKDYTCDGVAGNSSPSPELEWNGAPSGTVEFALTLTTVALDGTKYNWVLFHIPASTRSLAEGTAVGTAGVSTDGPDRRYYPPCSTGPGAKTYTFTLYALSAVPTFGVPESSVTGPILEAAIASKTLASRQLNVSYTRSGL